MSEAHIGAGYTSRIGIGISDLTDDEVVWLSAQRDRRTLIDQVMSQITPIIREILESATELEYKPAIKMRPGRSRSVYKPRIIALVVQLRGRGLSWKGIVPDDDWNIVGRFMPSGWEQIGSPAVFGRG